MEDYFADDQYGQELQYRKSNQSTCCDEATKALIHARIIFPYFLANTLSIVKERHNENYGDSMKHSRFCHNCNPQKNAGKKC